MSHMEASLEEIMREVQAETGAGPDVLERLEARIEEILQALLLRLPQRRRE